MPLFKLFGVTVFLHWSWFLILFLMPRINAQIGFTADTVGYLWSGAVLVGLFTIVTMHEFGHALACRSVRGKADTIILLPIGGVALVQPPMRPLPVMWSLAAGPLVNVILAPVLGLAWFILNDLGDAVPVELTRVFFTLFLINGTLFIFNMMPVYPLDGGQIMQSILWLIIGRAKSLMIAGWTGIVVSGIIGVLAIYPMQDLLLALIAAFLMWQAWRGVLYARAIAADPEGVARAEEAALRGEPYHHQPRTNHPEIQRHQPLDMPPEWGTTPDGPPDQPRNEQGEMLDPRATGPATRYETEVIEEAESHRHDLDSDATDHSADADADEAPSQGKDDRFR